MIRCRQLRGEIIMQKEEIQRLQEEAEKTDLVFDGKNHEISNCVFNNNQALSGCSLFVERSRNTRTHLLGDWNNSGVKSRKTIDGSNDEAWGLYCYIKYNCA